MKLFLIQAGQVLAKSIVYIFLVKQDVNAGK